MATNLRDFPAPHNEPVLLPPGAIADLMRLDAERLHRAYRAGQPIGPAIKFPKLAKALGGSWGPGLHMVLGGTGVGKTGFGIHASIEAGCPVLEVHAEMAPVEIIKRHVAHLSGQYLGRFKSGEMTPESVVSLTRAAWEKIPHIALADATCAWASEEWLYNAAMNVRGDSEHMLIVLDSIHAWAQTGGIVAPRDGGIAPTEYDGLNEGIAILRRLASRLSCSIVAIAERNRMSGPKGGLSSGAGTRKIEYSAETVLDLTTDPDAGYDARGEKRVTLKVEKNRNGESGKTIPMIYNGALVKFREE